VRIGGSKGDTSGVGLGGLRKRARIGASRKLGRGNGSSGGGSWGCEWGIVCGDVEVCQFASVSLDGAALGWGGGILYAVVV